MVHIGNVSDVLKQDINDVYVEDITWSEIGKEMVYYKWHTSSNQYGGNYNIIWYVLTQSSIQDEHKIFDK